jgi:Na+/proline symporter
MTCALLLCAFSGLYGVVYTDFVQFIIATGGAFLLAWLSVVHVGGLESMVDQLAAREDWLGHSMNLAPEIRMKVTSEGGPGAMSIWNVIGYFGILWWGVALSGGYQAQRILACKNTRHASNAMLMHTIVYYAVVSLPWVVVALASLIVFPDMGEAGHDAAYPRMILKILPPGLRGIMIAAMIAAFISTMSTLFNWGSSYIVNDLYRRFLHPGASDKHYVRVSRIVTFLVAMGGGIISFYADNIQQLLQIFYVVGGGAAVVGATRWLWWRINATGELWAFVMNWVVATLMLFGHNIFGLSEPLLDGVMGWLLWLEPDVSFTNDYDLLGARMLFMTVVGLVTVVAASLATPPTDTERLKEFVMKTRIFRPGWRTITCQIPGYVTAHPVPTVLIDWALVVATVCSLLFALNNVVRYEPVVSAGLFLLFVVLLLIVLYRTRRECPVDDA